jgi:hypothetical protein
VGLNVCCFTSLAIDIIHTKKLGTSMQKNRAQLETL